MISEVDLEPDGNIRVSNVDDTPNEMERAESSKVGNNVSIGSVETMQSQEYKLAVSEFERDLTVSSSNQDTGIKPYN